jgi:HlyD family secretion protein
MLCVGNYDVTQVLSGLQEGDRVALINAAMLQQARTAMQQRIQSRMGLPGVNQSGANRGSGAGGSGRGAGGGGSGGGRRGTP